MEKIAVYLIYLFYIFILPLCASTSTPTIIETIKTGIGSCKFNYILNDSHITKICATLRYPEDISNLTLVKETHRKTALCFSVYDALYKVCHYEETQQWSAPFNDTITFNKYLEKLVRNSTGETNVNMSAFCTSISGLTPMYTKTQPLMLKLTTYLKKVSKCSRICFNIEDEFDPLCAILAWSKKMDEEVKNSSIGINSNKNQPKKKTIDTNSQAKQLLTNETSYVIQSSESVKNINESNHNKTNLQTFINNFTDTLRTSNNLSKVTVGIDTKETGSKEAGLKEAGSKETGSQETDPNIGIKKEEVNTLINEETKATTLSEHTQDTAIEDSANQNVNEGEYNRNNVQSSFVENIGQFPDVGSQNQNVPNPSEQKDPIIRIKSEEDSHFFTYFTLISLGCVIGYIGYHNKQKIFAIVLEGRRSKNNRGRRRPSTASYRKLDCTLEEAITSQCNANVTHVIY